MSLLLAPHWPGNTGVTPATVGGGFNVTSNGILRAPLTLNTDGFVYGTSTSFSGSVESVNTVQLAQWLNPVGGPGAYEVEVTLAPGSAALTSSSPVGWVSLASSQTWTLHDPPLAPGGTAPALTATLNFTFRRAVDGVVVGTGTATLTTEGEVAS